MAKGDRYVMWLDLDSAVPVNGLSREEVEQVVKDLAAAVPPSDSRGRIVVFTEARSFAPRVRRRSVVDVDLNEVNPDPPAPPPEAPPPAEGTP